MDPPLPANPFERYDLDPREGIAAITQRLKEAAEDATDPKERERIRAAWEELTLHPGRRLRAALYAHPETRPALGNAPSLPRAGTEANALSLRDLAPRPQVLRELVRDIPRATEGAPPLDGDPVL